MPILMQFDNLIHMVLFKKKNICNFIMITMEDISLEDIGWQLVLIELSLDLRTVFPVISKFSSN